MSNNTNASEEVREFLIECIAGYGADPLGLILVVTEYLDNLGMEMQDPDLTFAKKFQIIADMKFMSDYLENVLISYSAEELREFLETEDEQTEQNRIFSEVLAYMEDKNDRQ